MTAMPQFNNMSEAKTWSLLQRKPVIYNKEVTFWNGWVCLTDLARSACFRTCYEMGISPSVVRSLHCRTNMMISNKHDELVEIGYSSAILSNIIKSPGIFAKVTRNGFQAYGKELSETPLYLEWKNNPECALWFLDDGNS